MTLTAARQVADAVLYEGYLLYPYRASSSKNQVRWQFGIVGPAGAVEAGVGEEPSMSCEVLVGHGGAIDVVLRFLQVQARVVQDATGVEVDSLQVGSTRWIPYHEAVPREIAFHDLHAGVLQVSVPGGEDVEELDGGRLVRTRWPLTGSLTAEVRPGTEPGVRVLRLRIDNTTSWSVGDLPGWKARDVAARYSFVGTHLLLTAKGTDFVSLLEGAPDAASCRQERCWPVLIAEDDGKDAVLVAPIILGDHPTIAPESAGDLFDATEIDEILTLRVMTMTEDEKAEARGTDPRAAAILTRCDGMSDAAMALLHGVRRPVDDDLWGADAEPEKDLVMVAGVPLSKGSRVILRPSRRADAQDMFLAGLTAFVARVYTDLDGLTHLAVKLQDDPGADLYDSTGRYYYFAPEELEPLTEVSR